jgi:hypothetical protein
MYSLLHVPLHVVLWSRGALSDAEGLKEVLLSASAVAGTDQGTGMHAAVQHAGRPRGARTLEGGGLGDFSGRVVDAVTGARPQRIEAALVAACKLPACAGLAGMFAKAAAGAHSDAATDALPVLMAVPPSARHTDLAVHISAECGPTENLLEGSEEALLEACLPLDPEEEAQEEGEIAIKLLPAAAPPLTATVTRQRLPLLQRWPKRSGFPRPERPVPLPIDGLAVPDEATSALLARLTCTAVAVSPQRIVHNAMPSCTTLTLEQPEAGVYKPSGRQVLPAGLVEPLLTTPEGTIPPSAAVPIRITVADNGHLRTATTALTTSRCQPVTLTTISAPPAHALITTDTVRIPLPPLPSHCQSPFPVPVLHTAITALDPANAPAHIQNLTALDARVFQQRDDVLPGSVAAVTQHPRDSLHNIFQEVPAYQRRPFLFWGRAPGSAGVLRLHFAVGLLLKINAGCPGGWPVAVVDWLGVGDEPAQEVHQLGSCKIVTDGAMAEDAEVGILRRS